MELKNKLVTDIQDMIEAVNYYEEQIGQKIEDKDMFIQMLDKHFVCITDNNPTFEPDDNTMVIALGIVKMEYDKMKEVNTTTTTTTTVATEADVGFIGRMFQMIIAGAASVWRELIDNKRLVLGVGNYYFALGKTTDGSYGLQVVFGSKIMTLSFKSVKDMLMKAWDLIKQTWANMKARSM